jgi:hypothetical protein
VANWKISEPKEEKIRGFYKYTIRTFSYYDNIHGDRIEFDKTRYDILACLSNYFIGIYEGIKTNISKHETLLSVICLLQVAMKYYKHPADGEFNSAMVRLLNEMDTSLNMTGNKIHSMVIGFNKTVYLESNYKKLHKICYKKLHKICNKTPNTNTVVASKNLNTALKEI